MKFGVSISLLVIPFGILSSLYLLVKATEIRSKLVKKD